MQKARAGPAGNEPSAKARPGAAAIRAARVPLVGPDDAREKAAERLAQAALGMPPVTTRPRAGLGAPATHLSAGPGEPLDAATRAYFEPRFGRDLAQVRVHADRPAAGLARELGAAAFTLGHDIGFAAGLYAPREPTGRALLAHELAHVVAQAGSPPVLARQTVEEYQTKGITIDPAKLKELAGIGYWEQKIRTVFQIAEDAATAARLENDREEREAVLSVAWNLRPPTAPTSVTTNLVAIPKRTDAGQSQNLLYQINFKPRANPAGHDTVEILFVAVGAGATAITPDPPSTSFTPKPVGYQSSGFPQKPDDYWRAHRAEERLVFSWIETRAPAKFDQIVKTPSATFEVKGEKDPSGSVSGLTIIRLAAAPSSRTPPAGYAAHDFGDPMIEEAQSTANPVKGDRLGTITGLDKVPESERASVKYAIWQYFRGGTRNAEIDAIVPIVEASLFDEARHAPALSPAQQDIAAEFALAGIAVFKQQRVFFTLRFRPSATAAGRTDVEIVRIGPESRRLSLDPRAALSLGRVNGFAEHSQEAAALKGWLRTRYRGIAPQGATVSEIEKDATTKSAPVWPIPNGSRPITGSRSSTKPTPPSGFERSVTRGPRNCATCRIFPRLNWRYSKGFWSGSATS